MTHRDISISISIFAYICSPNRRGLCVRRKFTSHMWWPGGAARICIRLLHISWGNFNKLRVGLFFLIKIWRKTCTWSFYTQKWSFSHNPLISPDMKCPKWTFMCIWTFLFIFLHMGIKGSHMKKLHIFSSYFFFIFSSYIFFIYFLHMHFICQLHIYMNIMFNIFFNSEPFWLHIFSSYFVHIYLPSGVAS